MAAERFSPDPAWLEAEGSRILDFCRAAAIPGGGFGGLDGRGWLPADAAVHGVLTCRKIHCYALAGMLGQTDAASLVEHGLTALRGPLRDDENGGWFATAPGDDHRKEAYLHAFVALCASTATMAGFDVADILDEAVAIIEDRFWSEEEGALRERFEADWTGEMDYRGANANMHGVEAFLALAEATANSRWTRRALRIAERLVHRQARRNGYAVIEHFDRDWSVLRDFNADHPHDDLRPFGMTPGHYAEWAHLLLRIERALQNAGETAPDWLLEDAKALFAALLRDGWREGKHPGIVYTVDWDGAVSVGNRPHWVVAEAIVAADALHRRTGEAPYRDWYDRFWTIVEAAFIDREFGGWWNELDEHDHPSQMIYRGKPDLYHIYQATLAPRLPFAPSYAAAVRRSRQG